MPDGASVLIHNHLENNRCITTKTGLVYSLRQFYQSHEPALYAGYSIQDSLPKSFIVTAGEEDFEYKQLLTKFSDLASHNFSRERLPEKHCLNNMWLVKPAALNQGRGIEVVRNVKDLQILLKTKPEHSLWVVQKYIERPLLFKNRKFDIRVWALATAKHEFFYYKHGYLRTSSHMYLPDATDSYVHLTNNCLQKHGENYGKHEDGNTLLFSDFQEYLDEAYPDLQVNVWEHLVPRMKDLMIDAYLSGKKQMGKDKRPHFFELLGFDFLIDEDFRVWLLEVNTNPYLGIPNKAISDLLPMMIDDLLAITIDPYYPPKNPRKRSDNDFELLYCEVASIYSKDGLSFNARSSYSSSLYPIAQLAQPTKIKMRLERGDSEIYDPGNRQGFKDTLQIVKEAMNGLYALEANDYKHLCGKIMGQLKNWEFLAREQLRSSLEGLKLLLTEQGAAIALCGHISSLMDLLNNENVPDFMACELIQIVESASLNSKFCREGVKAGLVSLLVNHLYSNEQTALVLEAVQSALLVITHHPSKGAYIPGSTPDHNWVRSSLLNSGIPSLFYVKATESVRKGLLQEFSVSEWESQMRLLDANNLAFQLTEQDISCAQDEVGGFCKKRREEIQARAEKEMKKKKEEEEKKAKKELEELRINEEKKSQAMEYIQRRCEEIKNQKSIDERKRKEYKEIEEKFNESKRQQVLEKANKREEHKRTQRMREKAKEMEKLRVLEEQKKIKEESRKKALEDWSKRKKEMERDKREQLKKEEDEKKKLAEQQARKQENMLKLEEKRQKRMREERLRKSEEAAALQKIVIFKPPSIQNFSQSSQKRKPKKPLPKTQLDKFLIGVYRNSPCNFT